VQKQGEDSQEDSLTDTQVRTSLQLLLSQEINVQRQGEDNFASTNIVKNDMQSKLQRQNTEISKQIFPEKEYRGLSPNFHIHASVSDLYIHTIGLPILLEKICGQILGLYKSLTDT
jgi:hypothetical protein